MHPRQELIELFSAFIQFEGDRFHGWVSDSRLRRNVQQCLKQNLSPQAPSTSESVWALYWYQRWVEEEASSRASLPLGHLSAYLQEPCYWTAVQATRKFTSIRYRLSDCFQIAIAEVHAVLERFQPRRGASLKSFAMIAFSSLLRDHLRQRQEASFCTNLGLLRKVSKKRLLEALKHAGLPASTIAQHSLAWMCFNTLYVQFSSTGTSQSSTVSREQWHSITDLYNTERLNQGDPSLPVGKPETIEHWLNQCANWVRAYLYPSVESLNAPKPGFAPGSEVQDDLSDSLHDSLLNEFIAQEELQERQQQKFQLHHEIVTTLKSLDVQSQELLRLYYQQGLTQQQIMQQLQMSQSTVSRRLTKARETLLTKLVQWSQEQLNSSPTPTLVKDISAALEEWLGVYYSGLNSVSSSKTAGKETES
jgi:RNA polymerase sigma factor (sigma-70 family)